MQLLVSVSNADEAHAAIEGGASIIDAKDPHTGALGPVTLDVLGAISRTVGHARVLTAAIGDIHEGSGLRTPGSRVQAPGSGSDTAIDSFAYTYAAAGAALVKLGCTGDVRTAGAAFAAAVRGASQAGAGVIAVAYADANAAAGVTFDTVIDLALTAGARGVLVDTANKGGPGLTSLVPPARLAAWTARAQQAGLLAAVAGSLSLDDLPAMAACGADVVGVRGAACEGGRLGRVTAPRVAALVARLRSIGSTVGAPVSERLPLIAGTPTVFQESPERLPSRAPVRPGGWGPAPSGPRWP